MSTLTRMHTPNSPVDGRSLSLLFIVYGIKYLSTKLNIIFLSIDVKLLLEWLGVLVAFSTITYNLVKTVSEVRTFFLSIKEKRKAKKKIEEDSYSPPMIDEFD